MHMIFLFYSQFFNKHKILHKFLKITLNFHDLKEFLKKKKRSMTDSEQRNEDEKVDRFTSELEDLIGSSQMVSKSLAEEKNKQDSQSNISSKPKNPFMKPLFITISVILVVLILAFIFRPRRPPRSPFLPIPYIFNRQFMKTVLRYASLPSHNQVLVISGPQGIGKTRGLSELTMKLNNSGNLPLLLDFKQVTQYSSHNDIKEFLLNAVYNAFQLIDNYPLNKTEIRIHAPFINNIVIADNLVFRDQNLHKIYSMLNQTLTSGADAEYDQFFSLLDTVSNFLHIVIVANQPYRFQPFITYCHGISANTLNMGIIFDIDNIFENNDILGNPEIFRVFYVEEFDEITAKTIFVDLEFVFTKKQFPVLWKAFGGKGFYWAEYYDLIREGFSQNDAIKEITDKLANRIILATTSNSDAKLYSRRISFLKMLNRRGEITFSMDEKIVNELTHFGKWELFLPTGPNRIVLTNDKIMTAAIKKALKSL
ncbi:hypothetical protein TRFO_10997 [Tritrichomonas foetus]|uniref:Uncharacterized protein n=1 Tax=Tritrichomonas foetus TaxID=1144522 RepID=A0A1J4J5W6_9EUKA|nr:hypothetical protein TRFO_10997 [Tritrichomonas foetus]|eukprot:OHS94622.1 hypothetical protein TRFO_10997 [Tritrichomonas foetus]